MRELAIVAMPRVTFSDPGAGQQPQTGERAPLLQPPQHSYDASRSSILLPSNNGNSKSLNASSNSESYLPLHRTRRGRRSSDKETRIWSVLWRTAAAVLLLCLACAGTVALADGSILRHPTGPHPAPPPTAPGTGLDRAQRKNPAVLVRAQHGAVATENKVCSDLGVNMLKRGGNAVDAGVASALCIGVVNLFSCAGFLSYVLATC